MSNINYTKPNKLDDFSAWCSKKYPLWCKSNFPFIEDTFEALDTYGLICKIVQYLNETKQNLNTTEDNVQNIYNFVTNYFDNLDVREEINNKLDEMASDGSLTLLIKSYVDPYITEQNNRIDNQDIKITGLENEIAKVVSGNPLSATSIAEMTDTTRIYVNTTDGKWYYYDGDSWEIGGIYQSSVNSSDTNKLQLEFLNTEGYLYLNDLAYGNVTSQKTPILTDHTDFMYMIIDINDLGNIKELFSYFKDTIYNVLVKRSLFDENNTLTYVDGNWLQVTNGDSIVNLDNLNYTKRYVGFTFIYSTDLTATNRIENIPLDELYLTESNTSNNTNISNIKENYKILDKNYMGYEIYNIFEYGGRFANQFSNPSDKSAKYIKLSATDFTRDLYLNSTGKTVVGNVFVYVSCTYQGTEVFNSSVFMKKVNNEKIANTSWKESYTFDTMYITTRYCTSDNYNPDNLVENLPLNDIFITPYINSINSRIITIENTLSQLNSQYDAIVDINGNYDYTSINEAIENTQDGDSILIMPGTYEEDVRMFGQNRKLIGNDRDTCIILSDNGMYNTPALEANIGEVKNLTIISGNDQIDEDSQYSKAYGIHIEWPNNTPYSIDIENCHIISYGHSGIGIGCRYNQTINIKNCVIETKASHTWSEGSGAYIDCGAILFHNDAMSTAQTSDGRLNIINCELIGKSKTIMVRSIENGNRMTVKFIGNVNYKSRQNLTNVVGYWGSYEKGNSPYFCGTDIILDNLSYNNRSNEIDYDKYWD